MNRKIQAPRPWLVVGLALTLLISQAFAEPSLSPEQEQEWRSKIRETLFIPDPLPPLEPRTHGVFEIDDQVAAERVTYGTQFGMRVPAILYLPRKRAGKIPAFIVVNGHGGDKYSWYSFYTGVLYAHGGAAVLTYDPAGEGERNPERKSGTRAHDELERIPELGRRQGGLMVMEVMQAVSFLSQRPEVDSSRIAAAGYSMGSFVLSLAGAIEQRLRACVLAGGGNLDGPGEYWDRSKPMCQGFPYQSLKFLGDRPAAIYALHASRGPTLVMNGLEDSVVNIPKTGPPFMEDLHRRTAELRGSAEGLFEARFVAGVSHRPFFVTAAAALWLEDKIDLPNWSPEKMRNMPVTHVKEWAAAEGVEMDHRYSSEEREGGARALGTFVPGLSRETLSVFTQDEWEQAKHRLVIGNWVREAMARIRKNP